MVWIKNIVDQDKRFIDFKCEMTEFFPQSSGITNIHKGQYTLVMNSYVYRRRQYKQVGYQMGLDPKVNTLEEEIEEQAKTLKWQT